MPLLNSFIDSLVCVGFSSDRGLTLESESKAEATPFTSNLKSSILAIVTNDRAIYPVSRGSECVDASYPPMSRSGARSSLIQSYNSGRSTPLSSLASSIKTQKQHIVPVAYEDLPYYCFPDGVRATYQREKEKIHHFVLTQEGKRTYAIALTFQQSFTLQTEKPGEDGVYQINDVILSTQTAGKIAGSKIPVAVVKKRNASPSPTPVQPTPVTKTRSKIPSSYHNVNAASAATRSTSSDDLTKESKPSTRHYETPTINSYLKSKSTKATPPPPRVSRARSQDNVSVPTSTANKSLGSGSGSNTSTNTSTSTGTSTGTSGMRNRAGSNIPKPLQLKPTLSSSSSTSVVSPTTPKQPSSEESKPFYLPHCIVLISTQPYWTAMQETISIIHDEIVRSHIEPSSREYKKLIQKYAFLACNTPIPPIPWERFSLSFNVSTDRFVLTFDPPINANRSVLDLDLSVLLITLNIGRLLDVLAAVFTEQPIIFFCSNYSTLVTTLECLLYLIYPLKWDHLYIPLVPDGLRDVYLDGSSGFYIKGAHPRHQSIVEELKTSLTCNLESDKNVRVPKNIEFHSLPPTKLSNFLDPITQLLEEIKVARALKNVPSAARLPMEQQRELDRQQRYETNQKIIKIFLDFMVDLCGDALEPMYWKVNPQQPSPPNTLEKSLNEKRKYSTLSRTASKVPGFNKERYLLPKTEGIDLEFYQSFVNTVAFQNFLQDEMTSTTETPSAFKQICQLRSLSTDDQLYHVRNSPAGYIDNNPLVSELALCDSLATQMILPLPDWSSDLSTHYLDSCIEVFTVEIDNVQQERSPAVMSIYAYLRGCALLARGEYLEGLRDLYLIENANLFPQKYIETVIVPRLVDECLLDTFLNESFYTNSPDWKKVRVRRTSQSMSSIDLTDSDDLANASAIQSSLDIFSEDWNIVENTLAYEQFSEYVHRLNIVLHEETTEALFRALLNWTDSSKTLKKKKNSLPNSGKLTEPLKSANKQGSTTSTFTFHDTINMLNDHRKGNQPATSSPKQQQQQQPTNQSNATLPPVLFESFLDVWQQLTAEKIPMNRLLPEDRQKQESILKMSSQGIVSKKDGPGQLILTQKRLYFLLETRTYVHLLTEILHIVSIDKYQHQTIFSSSKPGIKIHTTATTSSTSSPNSSLARSTLKSKGASLERELQHDSISLFFRNNQEQELWHTIIVELWSGLTIAHQQCDTAVLNRAARHIVLMDTLANIDYDEENMSINERSMTSHQTKSKQLRRNQANLELALKELSIFTRMYQTRTFKPLSDETRRVLIRRLSPSISERERHAVRCLVFTEHLETGRSSLWCAYGAKLKVFNVSTWICDPNGFTFSSLITCMCLDGRAKLWIQCAKGELFIVDTVTHIREAQLETNDGENSCQSITYDSIRNHILTANRMGIITLWNASNWQRLTKINLFELYQKAHPSPPNIKKRLTRKPNFFSNSKETVKPNDTSDMSLSNAPPEITLSANDRLERIQVYNNLLFACYREDYIMVLRINEFNTYQYEHIISVKYKSGDSILIDSFLVYNNQLWVSTGCIVSVFNVRNPDDEISLIQISEENDNGYNLIVKRPVEDDNVITMLGFSGYLWAGSLNGNVYVFRMDNYELYKTFTGHHDSVWSLCSMLDMYVVSGSAQKDTSIAIWENIQTTEEKPILSSTIGKKPSDLQGSTKKPINKGDFIKPTDLL